jgi:trimethylamine--corrinoid protein Co-methyltransferase
VNKRHYDMVEAHLRLSDKPFMGSVTHPQRARDTVDMARIVFGEVFVEQNTVIFSLINANSPLVWDATMLGAARAYAEANQAVMMTPFILAGAMSPATVAATCAQTLAESLAGMTYVQLVRPGAPVVLGSFASSMSMQSGAPTRRPRTRVPRPSSRRSSVASTSCCMRPAGWKAASRSATRNSSWTPTNAG